MQFMRTIAGLRKTIVWPNYIRFRILDVDNTSGRTLVCGNRPKGRLSQYRPILHYSHQLVRRRNKNPDAQICVAHACGSRPKGRLSLWPDHYIYYMVNIDNLNFGTTPILGQSAQRKAVLLHRTQTLGYLYRPYNICNDPAIMTTFFWADCHMHEPHKSTHLIFFPPWDQLMRVMQYELIHLGRLPHTKVLSLALPTSSIRRRA